VKKTKEKCRSVADTNTQYRLKCWIEALEFYAADGAYGDLSEAENDEKYYRVRQVSLPCQAS